MYLEIQQGKSHNIQGLNCHVPPEGYVWNILTQKLEYRGVYKRSSNIDEQYWERLSLPNWYKDTMKRWDMYDEKKKDNDPDFYDEDLEKFKQQEWDRRLNGFWFMNNGTAVYLNGMHYLFLMWWLIDIGYPRFRIIDLEYFYFLQYCIEDPDCYGMIEVCKRRNGKTFRAGLFLIEYITRTKMTNAGIQSKTGMDAKKVFGKAVVQPFKKLPKFFRPEYDMSLGVTPKTEMRFQQTNIRGKKAESNIDRDELGSTIDHQSADPMAYDGQKIHRGFNDEFAKCFGKGTKIRMYDGSIKCVEDVENGEYVMGDDSTPRLVSGKITGRENMYMISPNKGNGFVCNESHILTLSVSDKVRIDDTWYKTGDVIDMTVREYLRLCPTYKKALAIYRTGWELPKNNHLIDPYMLGVWLGDGSSNDFSITSIDTEIIESINIFADEHGLYIRVKEDKISYHVTSRKVGKNHITAELRRLSILKNKHIPKEYLIDSRENRLQLLAGIIDTDGYSIVRNGFSSGMEVVQKREQLAYDIHELATSLGFYSSIRQQKSTMKRKDGTIYTCPTYKIIIYGDVDLIPNRVKRKKAIISRTKNRRNPLKSGFVLEPIGDGEYYGFKVDRNNLFLLADGTVVHNTVECNIYDRHEVLRYCVLDDEGNIIGKLLYSSTVEKLDTDKDGVQEGAQLLWNESDQLNKQANGQTVSGLYRFFMTALRSKNFDVYGEPDIEKTKREIEANREAVKGNPRALSARKRKEPITIDEAFSSDSDKSIFNTENIDARKKHLRENPIPMRKVIFYRDEETQQPKWRDTIKSDGDFYWECSPDFDLKPNKDTLKFVDGLRAPNREEDGVVSIDSYANSQGGQKYGSKASAWFGDRRLFKVTAHLYGRPGTKDDLHNQVMLCAEFRGVKAYYEFTADDYFRYFRDRGRIKYLGKCPLGLISPDEIKKAGEKGPYRPYGTPLSPFSLTRQHDIGISYFEHHCDLIDFIVILERAPNFDPYDRTKQDAIVSFLINVTVLSEPIRKPRPPKESLVRSFVNNQGGQNF